MITIWFEAVMSVLIVAVTCFLLGYFIGFNRGVNDIKAKLKKALHSLTAQAREIMSWSEQNEKDIIPGRQPGETEGSTPTSGTGPSHYRPTGDREATKEHRPDPPV